MFGKRKRGGKGSKGINSDLNLLPLMNIVIVLIPMLLLSAVYIEVRAIDMTPAPVAAAASENVPEALELSVRIVGGSYVVEGKGLAPAVIARPARSAPGATASRVLVQTLAAIAAAHPENKEIRIIAEPGTRYEEIVTLMDLARSAGLPSASLVGMASEG